MKDKDEYSTTNRQMVSARGGSVFVIAPKMYMDAKEAMTHAAWIVSVAEAVAARPNSGFQDLNFDDILAAVRST